MIEAIRQGLKDDGFEVSIAKLCSWFGIARRSVYYRPCKSPSKIQEKFSVPIKEMIEAEPSFPTCWALTRTLYSAFFSSKAGR